jgi:hypothetical protein
MLKLNPLEVAFELENLSAVCIHCVLYTIPFLVDLLDDDLGISKSQIAKSQYSLDAKAHCYTESVD